MLLRKVRIHPASWLVVGIAVLTARFEGLLMLFTVVFIHEMGHAAAAAYYKWRIKSIVILPFGGALETEEYGNRSLKEELHVILAGPLQHIWLFGGAYLLYMAGLVDEHSFRTFAYVNGAVCLFNLVPAWPLDGGKLLFLLLSLRSTFLESHKQVLQWSMGMVFAALPVLLLLGSFNLNLFIILVFILFSVVMEWRQKQYAFIRFLLERHHGKSGHLLRLKPITVDESEKVHDILQLFQKGYKHPVIVMKDGKEKGKLDENELLHAYFTEKLTSARAGDLLYDY